MKHEPRTTPSLALMRAHSPGAYLIRSPEALLHDFDRSYTRSVRVEVVEPIPVNGAVAVAVEAVEAYVTDTTATRYNEGNHYHQVEGKELT